MRKEKIYALYQGDNFLTEGTAKEIAEECFELQEAITKREAIGVYAETSTEDIKEELADCFVILNQIKEYYNITDEELRSIMSYKVDRTLKRMEG